MRIVRHVEADAGQWLKALRGAYGWTQPQLADVLDVHWVSVARWENGDRNISGRHRVALNVLARERGIAPLAPRRRAMIIDIERGDDDD